MYGNIDLAQDRIGKPAPWNQLSCLPSTNAWGIIFQNSSCEYLLSQNVIAHSLRCKTLRLSVKAAERMQRLQEAKPQPRRGETSRVLRGQTAKLLWTHYYLDWIRHEICSGLIEINDSEQLITALMNRVYCKTLLLFCLSRSPLSVALSVWYEEKLSILSKPSSWTSYNTPLPPIIFNKIEYGSLYTVEDAYLSSTRKILELSTSVQWRIYMQLFCPWNNICASRYCDILTKF